MKSLYHQFQRKKRGEEAWTNAIFSTDVWRGMVMYMASIINNT